MSGWKCQLKQIVVIINIDNSMIEGINILLESVQSWRLFPYNFKTYP